MGLPSAHPVDIGTAAEVTILAALVTRGYRVLVPYGTNHRYDLAIDVDGVMIRAQCKSGRLRDGRVLFNTLSTRSNTYESRRSTYRGSADIFLVWCRANNGMYCVSVADTTQSVATLRLVAARNGQRAGIRWASDHTLDIALPAAVRRARESAPEATRTLA